MEESIKFKDFIKKAIMIIWKVITFQYISYDDYLNVYESYDDKYCFLIEVMMFVFGMLSFCTSFSISLVFSFITLLIIYVWRTISYSKFVIKGCAVDKIDKDIYRLNHFKFSIKYIIGMTTLVLNLFYKLLRHFYFIPIFINNVIAILSIILFLLSLYFILFYIFIKNGNILIQLAGMLVSSVFGIVIFFMIIIFIIQTGAPNYQFELILKYIFPVLLFIVRELNTYYQGYLIISILIILLIHVSMTFITPAYRLKKLKAVFKLMNIIVLLVGYFSFAYLPVVYNSFLEGKKQISEFVMDKEMKRELNEGEKEFIMLINEDIASFSENEANSSLVLLLLPYSLSYLICMLIIEYMENVNREKLKKYREELDSYLNDEYPIVGYILFAYDKYIVYEDDEASLKEYTDVVEPLVKDIDDCLV